MDDGVGPGETRKRRLSVLPVRYVKDLGELPKRTPTPKKPKTPQKRDCPYDEILPLPNRNAEGYNIRGLTNFFGPTKAFEYLSSFFSQEVDIPTIRDNSGSLRELFTYGCYIAPSQYYLVAALSGQEIPGKNFCFICGKQLSPERHVYGWPEQPPGSRFIDACTTAQAEHLLPSALAFFLFGLPSSGLSNIHASFVAYSQTLPPELKQITAEIINQNRNNAKKQYRNFGWAHPSCNVYKSAYVLPDIIQEIPQNAPLKIKTQNFITDAGPISWNTDSMKNFPHGIGWTTLPNQFKRLFHEMNPTDQDKLGLEILNNIKFVCCVALHNYYKNYLHNDVELENQLRLVLLQTGGKKHKGGGTRFINPICAQALFMYFKKIRDSYTPAELEEINERIENDSSEETPIFNVPPINPNDTRYPIPKSFSANLFASLGLPSVFAGGSKTRRRKRTKRTKHRKTRK